MSEAFTFKVNFFFIGDISEIIANLYWTKLHFVNFSLQNIQVIKPASLEYCFVKNLYCVLFEIVSAQQLYQMQGLVLRPFQTTTQYFHILLYNTLYILSVNIRNVFKLSNVDIRTCVHRHIQICLCALHPRRGLEPLFGIGCEGSSEGLRAAPNTRLFPLQSFRNAKSSFRIQNCVCLFTIYTT